MTREKLKNLGYGVLVGLSSATVPLVSFADGESGGGLSTVSTAITKAGTDVIAAAGPIIASAVGVGITFWAAKTLWRKYKDIAG